MFLVSKVIAFFIHSLALKLSVDRLKEPGTSNEYSTALSIGFGLTLVGWLLSLIPFYLGTLLYPLVWLLVVRQAYRLSFMRSVMVAVLQFFVSAGLVFVLKLVGLLDVSTSVFFF